MAIRLVNGRKKGHKTAIKIQVFERREKDADDYHRFAIKLRRYAYKFNIYFKPVMLVPVVEINSKERLGQFVADQFGVGEFYVMAYRKPIRKSRLRVKKYARVEPFKIAFVKVMDVAGQEQIWCKTLYPMKRYWFWRNE